jgi:protein involved in polysaccharide export with SLBB domain
MVIEKQFFYKNSIYYSNSMGIYIKESFKLLFFGLILTSVSLVASGQSLQDIQNVRVDNLSDAQIEQLIKRAQSSGLTEQQLESMARERGMPATEVAKLRQRIQELGSGRRGDQSPRGQSQRSRQVQGIQVQDDVFDSLRRSDPYYDLTPRQKKIFGFTLFHNRELNFNPSLNIPTPDSYIIGSGDQLLIDVYGASQQSYDLEVNPEGRVFIPNVGPVEVGGATVAAARSRLRTALGQIYSGLQGNNPNTFIQVRLGNIRTINVTMAGELRKPGTYNLPSFASVFNALYAAGGPNENGSFRHIQVYRNNQMVGETDVYNFLMNGSDAGNVRLQDNDVIIVQPLRTRVEIEGPVRRPGLFEIKPGEGIDDLLAFAGGFSDKAYTKRMTVRRTTGEQLKVEDIESGQYDTFNPQDGDFYIVGEILNRYENRVQVLGAVVRPGEFSLEEGMTVKSLIESANGLRADAFQNRATLYRTGDNLTQSVLSVDIQGILEGTVPDISLQREDVLNVASIYDVKEEFYVQISGEINRSGVYPYAGNMTVGDLVVRSGGFKESASNSYIEIARRMKDDVSGKVSEIITIEIDPGLKLSPEDERVALAPFDHVFIRKNIGFQREMLVEVEGEVNYPGMFALEKRDERISDVLKRAGGLNQFSYAKGATLIRRTEFYQQMEEEERKRKELQSLMDNLNQKRDSATYTEVEQGMVERVQRQLELLEEESLKREEREQAKRSEKDLEENRYALLEGMDTTSAKLDLRETEYVGIELEKILANPGSKYDIILQEGDIISIPKQLQTVRMRGEVLYPTTARYDINRGFKNYISRAGGFTEKARKGRSYVIYANGDVKRTDKILFFNVYPHIEPGAEIIVPEKPDRQRMSIQAWVGIASSLATLAILVDRLAQ